MKGDIRITTRIARIITLVVATLVGVMLLNRWLGRRWGATDAEVDASLPGDDLTSKPIWQTTHGTTIRASAADIWPWLVQMGITRGGWYLSERLDRLVWRIDNPSVDRIVPELQHLAVGDVIPDSVNGTAHFRVVILNPEKALVLHSRRHPITGIWPDLSAPNPGLYLDFTWAFILREGGDGSTRLLLRTRAVVMNGNRPAPTWTHVFLPMADFADFIYSRQMLRGIRRQVERSTHPATSPVQHETDGDQLKDSNIASGFVRPVDYSSRTRYRRPPKAYLRLQWLGPLITRLGLSPREVITLEVPGRRSGLIRRTNLVRVNHEGDDYLVALAGESEWVRNVRASGGRVLVSRARQRQRAILTEVPLEECAPIILSYLLRGGRRPASRAVTNEARYYFGLCAAPSLEEIRRIVDHYPVFRIVYHGSSASGGKTHYGRHPCCKRSNRHWCCKARGFHLWCLKRAGWPTPWRR